MKHYIHFAEGKEKELAHCLTMATRLIGSYWRAWSFEKQKMPSWLLEEHDAFFTEIKKYEVPSEKTPHGL